MFQAPKNNPTIDIFKSEDPLESIDSGDRVFKEIFEIEDYKLKSKEHLKIIFKIY